MDHRIRERVRHRLPVGLDYTTEKQMMFDGSVLMQTAGCETRALGTVKLVDPFGRPMEAHVLKDSPSLISLGRLGGEEGFSFRWEPGKKPQLKSADGFWMTLDVQNRVPVWPMGRRVPRGDDAESDVHSVRGDYACPNQEGGARGSGDKPVPSAQAEAAPDEPEDEDDATDVSVSESSAGVPTDVPKDHYLTHMPKHPKCEVCQSAKMQNRHCRKKGKETAHSDRHGAEKFGDLITADTFFSYDGVSEDGDVLGVVVCDAYTGWLACYPAAENRTEEAHIASMTSWDQRRR